MVNKVILVGRVGRDCELKYSQNGHPVANFSIATSKKIKEQVLTTWHNIVFFGKFAEGLSPYIKKGGQIYVEGEIEIREYETQDGQKKKSFNIIAQQIQLLGGKKEEERPNDPEAY